MALASEGTVRGAFDLDTRPAIRSVRDYRQEAARADVQTRQLGEQMDRAFGASRVTQIEETSAATNKLARDTFDTRMEVRKQWQGMTKDIQREAASIVSTIHVVRDRLRELGRERARPQIDVDGISKAIVQIDLLQARLAALGATRVTPNVAIGGRLSGGVGGGARAVGGGGGRGGGSGLLSLGGVGFAGIRGGTLLGVAGAALPAVQAAGAGAFAIGSSAASGALGAGAAGLGGLAPLVAGVGAIVSVAKPANESLKEVFKAQDAFTKAVREHGRQSKQAAEAEREMTRARRLAGPGAGYAAAQTRGLGQDWRRLTVDARREFYGFRGDTAQIARRAAPALAQNATTATTAFRREGTQFTRFLAGNAVQNDLGVFSRTFARELPVAERTLENVTLTMSRLARASIPFFREGNAWVQSSTAGWRSSTRDIRSTRREMEPLVESARDWGRLTASTFRLLRDIGRLGRPSGDSLVESLTGTFDRWDAWVNTHPEEVRAFFRDTAKSVKDMASGLAGVVGWLNRMATALRPLLDRFSQLVELVSGLGLIGAPGAIAALVGATRGVRGRAGGGMGAGGVPGGGMGAGAVAGGGMGAGSAAALGYLAARGLGGSSRSVRNMGLGRQGLATPEAFQQRYGNVAGARYAMPASALGAQAGGLSRAAGGLRAAGAGAARGYAPIALALGGLDFASTPGSMGERVQQAFSSATLGLIPGATTRDAARAQGTSRAAAEIAGLGPADTLADVRARRSRTQALRARALAGAEKDGPSFLGIGLHGALVGGPQDAERRRQAAAAAAYAKELAALTKQEEGLRRSRRQQLDDLSQRRAMEYGTQLPQAFATYRKAGQSRQEAGESTTGQVIDRLNKTKKAGVETLGEASLEWARAMAKRFPEMRGNIDRLNDAIEARFKRMGRRVSIVNGNILTGTKSEWNQIASAMAGATEIARQKTSADFTAIQRQAIGSLRAMGFGPNEAKGIVEGLEKGGRAGRAASYAKDQGPGSYQAGIVAGSKAGPPAMPAAKARGGMIAGSGLMDTVPTPDGGLAAPGEAWIANRHTLNKLSRATVAKFGMTAEQLITGETRRHAMPTQGAMDHARGGRYASGGVMGALAGGTGGKAAGPLPNVLGSKPGFAVLMAHFKPIGGGDLFVMSGNRPGSITTSGRVSNHASGDAIDISNNVSKGGSPGNPPPRSGLDTLHGYIGANIKSPPRRDFLWRTTVGGNHFNHIHLGMDPSVTGSIGLAQRYVETLPGGSGIGALGDIAAGDGAAKQIKVRGVGIKQAGVPGVMRGRAGDLYAKGLQTAINRKLKKDAAAGSGGDLDRFSGGGGGAEANRALARRMMLAYGGGKWGADQWLPLNSLWTRESNFDENAINPSSGAGGIPQALPPSKMGAGWQGNPPHQIGWGLKYIDGRYGSPAGAWAHSQATGWYARGGRTARWAGAFDKGGSFVTDGPTEFVAGEGPRNRRERVTVTPANLPSGLTVKVEAGAVVVQVGGDAQGIDRAAIGEEVVRGIIEAIDKGRASGVIG